MIACHWKSRLGKAEANYCSHHKSNLLGRGQEPKCHLHMHNTIFSVKTLCMHACMYKNVARMDVSPTPAQHDFVGKLLVWIQSQFATIRFGDSCMYACMYIHTQTHTHESRVLRRLAHYIPQCMRDMRLPCWHVKRSGHGWQVAWPDNVLNSPGLQGIGLHGYNQSTYRCKWSTCDCSDTTYQDAQEWIRVRALRQENFQHTMPTHVYRY